MNTQRRCGRMSKITENWLNTAVFGQMEHRNRSNVPPTESHKMSEHHIFLLQPFQHQQSCKSTWETQAIAGQRTVRLLLVLNDAHNPINNPRKQNTLLPRISPNDRRTISHHDGDVCTYHNDTTF